MCSIFKLLHFLTNNFFSDCGCRMAICLGFQWLQVLIMKNKTWGNPWKFFVRDILGHAGLMMNTSKDEQPAQDHIILGSVVDTLDLKFLK